MSSPALGDDGSASTVHDTAAGMAVAGEAELRNLEFEKRYRRSSPLGQGGMGEVIAVLDEQIGREIALKRMRLDRRVQPGIRTRFVREARVQAQLEHPSIVPVYDLGVDEAGDAWFTMKKVRGTTLAGIIQKLRQGEPEFVGKYSRRRLLTAFSSVCLAVEFAHARGIVHRDLKPENIMLGDFGEVYVLDWGIAKIASVSDDELTGAGHPTGEPGGAGGAEHETAIGEVLGTVGYMAPEQLLGMTDAIGPGTDVWALGAILFELLALESLMARTSLGEALDNIDHEVDAHPSARAPHLAIEPELDAICRRASARVPRDRYPSARALHDDLEQHLDGDRERERRRDQSALHLTRARDAEAQAVRGGPGALAQRTVAMQEINRALVLDPSSEHAQHAMVRLLVEAPPSVPEDARAERRAATLAEIRVAFRVGGLGFLSMYLFLPLYLWMGIRDWTVTGAVLALIGASAGALFWGARTPGHARAAIAVTVVTAGLLIALLTRVVGPFASAPVLAFCMAVGVVFNPTGLGMRGVLALVAIALVVPMMLELGGLISPSYAFANGSITIVPHMTDLPRIPTMVTLTLTSIATIVLAAIYLVRLQAMLRSARERQWLQAWNLRQFLPAAVVHPERTAGAAPR